MADNTLEIKEQLVLMENNLRLAGQKLDTLWSQARMATGQARINLHKQIGPLRIKMQEDRKTQEDLRKSGQ